MSLKMNMKVECKNGFRYSYTAWRFLKGIPWRWCNNKAWLCQVIPYIPKGGGGSQGC